MRECMAAIAIVLIFHILGDFYFQSNKLAAEKETSRSAFVKHCLLYALCMAVCCLLLFDGWWRALGACAILGLSHWLVDVTAHSRIVRGESCSPRKELAIFIGDQAAHVLFCLLVVCIFSVKTDLIDLLSLNMPSEDGLRFAGVVALCLALLAVGRPAAILIRLFLASIDASSEGDPENEGELTEPVDSCEANYIKAGRWIGILERIIVSIMTFWGAYSAIAFVFTAKSIARFKLLEDKSFAERYLVGTLASVAFAIVVTLTCKGMLGV